MPNLLPPDPPLDAAFLSTWLKKFFWMKNHRKAWMRMLHRLAEAHLELLSERDLAQELGEKKKEKRWTAEVKK